METRRCAFWRLRSFPLTHAVWVEELGLLPLVSPPALNDALAWIPVSVVHSLMHQALEPAERLRHRLDQLPHGDDVDRRRSRHPRTRRRRRGVRPAHHGEQAVQREPVARAGGLAAAVADEREQHAVAGRRLRALRVGELSRRPSALRDPDGSRSAAFAITLAIKRSNETTPSG